MSNVIEFPLGRLRRNEPQIPETDQGVPQSDNDNLPLVGQVVGLPPVYLAEDGTFLKPNAVAGPPSQCLSTRKDLANLWEDESWLGDL